MPEIDLSERSDISFNEAQLKDKVATQILSIFRWTNGVVGGLVLVMFAFDAAMQVFAGTRYGSADRLITGNVVMALIGATVVQVGAAVIAIVASLFPRGDTANEE